MIKNFIKKAGFFLSCLGAFLIIGYNFNCKLGTDTGDSSSNISALKIEDNEVSQWTSQSYRPFKTKNELFDIINGGADEYYDRGAIEGFKQSLSKNDYVLDCLVIYYGTPQKASAMYSYIKENNVSNKESAGSFTEDVAILDVASLDGCNAYCWFKGYYISLSFSGYGANKSEAKENAIRFIELFKSKVNSL